MIWLHFNIRAVAFDDDVSWSLLAGFPRPHDIVVYSLGDGVDLDGFDVKRAPHSGLMVPRASRAVGDDDEIVLPLSPVVGAHFVRIEVEPARLNLWIGADRAFAADRARSSLGNGFYYVIFVGLFFFNLLFGLSIREPAHLLYCVFLLCMGMQIAVRDGWLPDDLPMPLFRGAGLSITSLASLAFTRRFLNLSPQTTPVLSRVFGVAFAAAFATAVPPFFGVMGSSASMLVSLINTFVIAGAALSRALRGDRSAQLFSLAWGVLLTTSALAMLHALGVIRWPWVATTGMRVGAAAEMILLALALASRVGALRAAKDDAERALREREQAHADAMQRSLLEGQEAERARFARDLHDGLGHTLLIAKQRADDPELQQILGGAIDDMRGIARALMPARLESAGREEALRGLADDVAGTHAVDTGDNDSDGAAGVDVNVVVDAGASALAAAMGARSIHVFRVVQEALSNAIRHGEASTVDVALTHEGDLLVVAVSDDGVGLGDRATGGSGLMSMRERARLLGGSFDVGARVDGRRGTTVTLRLPVRTAA